MKPLHCARLFLVALLAGCHAFPVPPYAVSHSNIQSLKSNGPQVVTLGSFDTVPLPSRCRVAGDIVLPGSMKFADYIRFAIRDELLIAGYVLADNALTPAGDVPIVSGRVTAINFQNVDTHTTWDMAWTLAMTLGSTTGRTVSVAVDYTFPTSENAISACSEVAGAFMPAIQALVGKAVNSPEFTSLLQ